jgi:hypothetical protein
MVNCYTRPTGTGNHESLPFNTPYGRRASLSSTYLDLTDHYKAYCKGIKYNDGFDFSIIFLVFISLLQSLNNYETNK